jgi:hypothetical protein
MPSGPILVFALSVGMEDETCDIILGIPKENGLETKGID